MDASPVNKFKRGCYSLYYYNLNVEQYLLNLAKTIAKIPTIINAFEEDYPANIIYPLVESILNDTEDIQYIVIMNLQGIRYSHPNPSLIGDHFVGGDEKLAIKDGKSYISIAKGTLGLATRAFTPIHNRQGEIIGAVCVGILNDKINKQSLKFNNLTTFKIIAGAILGLMASSPSMLADMFQRLENLLNKFRLKKFNLNEKKEEYKNKHDTKKESYIIAPQTLTCVGMKNVGIFRSNEPTEDVIQLKEELNGTRKMINTLRENNHEVMNKLHVIMGLLKLKKYEEVEDYVNTFFYSKKNLNNIIKNIESSTVAALLISKYNEAVELGIELIVHPESRLDKNFINSNAIVTVLGNLIDNAFDAIKDKQGSKWVKLLIRSNLEELIISIKDNGIGMDRENKEIIFQRGFSTKEKGRGIGLYLVHKIVISLHGEIKVRTWPNKGTHFIIKLPKL